MNERPDESSSQQKPQVKIPQGSRGSTAGLPGTMKPTLSSVGAKTLGTQRGSVLEAHTATATQNGVGPMPVTVGTSKVVAKMLARHSATIAEDRRRRSSSLEANRKEDANVAVASHIPGGDEDFRHVDHRDHYYAHGNVNGAAGANPGTSPMKDPDEPVLRTKTKSFYKAQQQAEAQRTYHRIMIDGDEGDADYGKCAELIASIIKMRQSYKALDKGQKESPSAEQLNQFFRDHSSLLPFTARTDEELKRLTGSENYGFTSSPPAAPPPPPPPPPRSSISKDASSKRQSVVAVDAAASAPMSTDRKTSAAESESKAAAPTASAPEAPTSPLPPPLSPTLTYKNGIYHFTGMQTELTPWKQFVKDMQTVYGAIENGPCLSTARMRVTALVEKFDLYSLLNNELESNFDPYMKGGGVYAKNTRVDNMLNMKTCVPAPLFMDLITKTATKEPNTPLFANPTLPGQFVTIDGYLRQGGVLRPQDVTMEGLGMHPTLYRNKFIRYDMLDATCNPAGQFGARFLQAILSTDGPNRGDLCGTLVRSVLERNEFGRGPSVATEIMLELYGHHPEEVPRLAAWTRRQGFHKMQRNMWILSLQRRPPLMGPNVLPMRCQTIGAQLRYMFYPLFMATLYPKDPYWGTVSLLLNTTGAIHVDCQPVIRMENLSSEMVSPDDVAYSKGCSDFYFVYFAWCNVAVLNALRQRLGLHALRFSVAVREPPPAFDQLVTGFMLGDVVHHVSSLHKSWIMQFLYLYSRVGIVMSPLRDNVLRTPYFEHPVVTYFKQGMLISIATGDPLHFHHRLDQPLLEEYATLLKVRSLSPVDLCELARNSVLNSSFPQKMKEQWLGEGFQTLGSIGNDMQRSCLCDYRLQYRHECLVHEQTLMNQVLAKVAKKGQTPTVVNAMPFSGSIQVSDVVQQFRQARRMNYTDQSVIYPRIDVYTATGQTHELKPATEAVSALRYTIFLRKKYSIFRVEDVNVEDVFTNKTFNESLWEYNNYYGVFLLSRVGKTPSWPSSIPSVREFIRDVEHVRRVVSMPPLRRLAMHRLSLLEQKFLLHISMNIAKEGGVKEEKEWNNRDFFTAHKVDTNIQTDSGHNARTLLEFFVDKALNHGDDVVFEENGQPVTLRQLLGRYHIDVTQVTVDELHHQLHTHNDLHTIFLSPFNFLQGRYFAELTKRTLDIYKEDVYSFAEYRLSMQGGSADDWHELGHWFDRYGMANTQCRWMVCFSRQYRRLRQQREVRNFGEYLHNIFQPLWEISLHPANDTKLHYFLTHVSGFDCIDDESKIDLPLSETYPHDWDSDLNPPYNLYLYYLWANIATLNDFRASRGLGTFTFRPQCGEKGGVDHLIGGFLLAHGINHGVTLAKHPVMEYIYYITQLGVAMSPLSNTAGACAYLENPFPLFFHRGLNVSLATSQPLYFHFTREPLVEEYSLAAKLWRFEFNDLSEIARNSVLQCGFPPAWKQRALGPLYELRSTLGNEVQRSRVSDIRVAYRYEVYHTELNFLDEQLGAAVQPVPRVMKLLEEELVLYGEAVRQKVVSAELAAGRLRGSSVVAQLIHGSSPGAAPGSLGGAGGGAGEEEDDEDKESVERLRVKMLHKEIETLDKELARMRVVTQEVSGQNSSIAAEVQSLRDRLKTEGLVILGGLTGKVTQENSTTSFPSAAPSPSQSNRERASSMLDRKGQSRASRASILSDPVLAVKPTEPSVRLAIPSKRSLTNQDGTTAGEHKSTAAATTITPTTTAAMNEQEHNSGSVITASEMPASAMMGGNNSNSGTAGGGGGSGGALWTQPPRSDYVFPEEDPDDDSTGSTRNQRLSTSGVPFGASGTGGASLTSTAPTALAPATAAVKRTSEAEAEAEKGRPPTGPTSGGLNTSREL